MLIQMLYKYLSLKEMDPYDRFCGPGSPFVEGGRALFGHHGPGTVEGAAVLSGRRVHVARLHHIHRRRDHCRDEPRSERRHEMTRKIVCEAQTPRNHCCT